MAEMSKAPRVVKRCGGVARAGRKGYYTMPECGAHEDEDEAACEGGVLGHRVARLKGLIKHSRFEDSDESALCPGKVTKHDIGTENGSLESTGQPCGQPMVAAASDKNIGPVDDELYAL